MALSPIPIDGRTLAPDITGGIQRGQQILQNQNILAQQRLGAQQQEQAAAALAQQQETARQLALQSQQGKRIETGQQLAQLMVDNPDLAQSVLSSAGVRDDFQKQDLAKFGFMLEQSADNPELQNALINRRIANVQARGGDPRDSAALLDATPDRRAQFARTVQLAALTPEQRQDIASSQQLTPFQEETLKLRRQEIAQKRSKLTGDPTPGAEQRFFESLVEDLPEEEKTRAALVKLGLSPRAVGSAEQTISAEGIAKEIGDSNAIIKEREKFGELQGASRSKAIDSGFEKISKIDKNVGNLDKAIEAVQQGAGTGAIERRFPSIKAASVALEQIQGELALDVIGAVTFGALSEGELDLAKQIALPTGLDGPQLIKHLQDRKSAQEKLRNYFSEQIDFLDQGGSVAGFLRQKERQAQDGQAVQQEQAQAQQPTNVSQNRRIVFDTQGNMIQ